MTEKKSLNSLIIHPDIEPGVIDNAMLTRCILEYGRLIFTECTFGNESVISVLSVYFSLVFAVTLI